MNCLSQDTVLSLDGTFYWTKWLDRDNATGYGDEETYKDFNIVSSAS